MRNKDPVKQSVHSLKRRNEKNSAKFQFIQTEIQKLKDTENATPEKVSEIRISEKIPQSRVFRLEINAEQIYLLQKYVFTHKLSH
jgi:hypothetical protein